MANIYFKHLSISNFMSYEKADIDLNRFGNILVGGINNNTEDNAKSNGCGKSSLFSALSWCLTGTTTSGAKDVANIYTTGKTEVSVTFDLDNTEYKIVRTKNPSNLYIYIDGMNRSGKGIRDTEKLLSGYLPQISSELINSVIILGQGLPQRFTNNSPSGRKEVLEKLSNSDFMIADLKDRLSYRKTLLVNQQRKLQDDNLSKTTLITVNNNSIQTFELELDSLESKDSLIKEQNSILFDLKEIEQSIVEYVEFEESLIELLKNKKLIYDNLNKEYYDQLNSIEKIDTSEKERFLIELKSECRVLQTKIAEFENVTDVCPTCGQKLPNVVKFDTTDLKIELEEKKALISTLETELVNIKLENETKIQECTALYEEKLRLAKSEVVIVENDIESNKYKLSTLNDKKTKLDRALSDILYKINSLEENIKYKQDKILELTTQNKNLLSIVEANTKKLETIEERLDINNKMQTLIKRDFRGYLLNNVILFIESRTKLYAKDIFGTDNLSFRLDGNNIDISYDNKDYSVLSGGEKQKLDIIIQFAIRDMLCKFLDFSSNILVLDEITDSLDSIGVDSVFNLISSNLIDIEAVYIISHHTDELSIPSDDEILIIKGNDKISRIM